MLSEFMLWASSWWSKALPWVIAIAGAIGGLVAIRQSGKSAAYAEIAQKQEVQTNAALKITQEDSAMSDAAVADKLRKFYRD